jgi:peptide/nickel transport system substrate-binding protein
MVRVAALCLFVLLAGCSSQESPGIVFAVATAPTVLDPRLATDAASDRVNQLLYDRLVRIDENGRPQPAMATWQMLSPRHYRVVLRPDRAPFWDGVLPTVDDVVATYQSIAEGELASPHSGALAHLARIERVSTDTIDFHLGRDDALFPARLTIGIVPAARLGAGDLARRPAGSGPFVFDQWREDGAAILHRRRDSARFTIEPVPDPTMRVLKLLRGEAQLLQNDLPVELFRYLEHTPGVSLAQVPGITFAYLGMRMDDPVLADRNVRAAIAHAIDREAIIEHLFGGLAQPAGGVLRPGHWAAADDLRGFRYAPELARDLLAQAGYGPERPLQLGYKTSTDPFRLRIAHVLQAQLQAVGIELSIASYDWGTFFGDIKAGRFQLYSLAWVGVNTPDILRYAFHSESLPPDGANRGRYRSGVVDQLVEAAQQAPAATAADLYADAQRKIHDDIVYVPLWYEANVSASRGLYGYVPGHDGNYLALKWVEKLDVHD